MSVAPLIRRLAPQYGIDPRAAIAVALGEGGLVNRSQDIGDLAGGGSYGPFQLYAKGALPRHLVGNSNRADSWAWSPEGIKYALSRMNAAGAAGLSGPAAVEAIIRKFERPANPDRSVAAALSRLGQIRSGGSGEAEAAQVALPGSSLPAPATNDSNRSSRTRNMILQGLIRGDDPNNLLQSIARLPVMPTMTQPPAKPVPMPSLKAAAPAGGKGIRELIYDPLGSVFDGVRSRKAYGGHDKHVHFAGTTPQQLLSAIRWAQQLGLSVRENPYTDPVDPVHTKGSHHYQVFPGKYNGRTLGQAVDVSGNPARLRTLFERLAALG